jgi:hypothetical protein
MPRGALVGNGPRASLRSVVESCRTVLADSTPSAKSGGRPRVSDAHASPALSSSFAPAFLAHASAGTRVRIGDDVLAPPGRLATGGRVGSDPLRPAGLARSR